MIEKIQEKIDKYEVLENEANTFESQHEIGNFLADLQELLKAAKEKKKACCEKKEATKRIVNGLFGQFKFGEIND